MIRVKFDAAGALGFEIEAADGKLLAHSGPYRSICRLESALAVLQEVAQQRANAVLKPAAEGTLLSLSGARSKVVLHGAIAAEQLPALLNALMECRVLDERPAARRRTDVSGQLRQFSGH